MPWILSVRQVSCVLLALFVVGAGCDNEGGTASDTDATTTTDGTATTTNSTTNEPTTDDTTTDDATSAPTTTDTSAGMVDYGADIQPIWDANCTTGCHTTGGTAATWFLITPDVSHASIVGTNSVSFPSLVLVTPGDRDASYLWHKINGTHFEAGGGGTAMPPPPAAMLSSADLDMIGTWIDAGASE